MQIILDILLFPLGVFLEDLSVFFIPRKARRLRSCLKVGIDISCEPHRSVRPGPPSHDDGPTLARNRSLDGNRLGFHVRLPDRRQGICR